MNNEKCDLVTMTLGKIEAGLKVGSARQVAAALDEHYRVLSRESMRGYTPTPRLRDYWYKVAKKFKSVETYVEKLDT